MQIVFNNPVLYVVSYPSVDSIEVIDKRLGRGTLLSGDTAARFRVELANVLEGEEDEQEADLDIFLDQFDALMTQPAIYQ